MAKRLVQKMVSSAVELVPAKLPTPGWLEDTLVA